MVAEGVLILVALGFAWNLGAHYTGAVMGMPYATGSIGLSKALLVIALFTIIGATFASGRVETTVGFELIDPTRVGLWDATAIVLAAGALTLLYNALRLPTSTIQLLVFCVVGVGLAAHIAVQWGTIERLAIVWVTAPLVAVGLGYLFTRGLDRLLDVPSGSPKRQTTNGSVRAWAAALPKLLVFVGVIASFALGANDVSNATGALVLSGHFSLMLAGLLGGVAMAIGALTWGKGLLRRVAFDVVKMDLAMASAAQGVQALVVLVAVTQGLFTSMNQALIGAMAGTGLARGRQTIQGRQIRNILLGWLIGPLSGLVLGFLLELGVGVVLK